MSGRFKQTHVQHAWRIVAALMLAAAFAFVAPGASTGAAACGQTTVKSSAVGVDYAANVAATASSTALERRIVAHCCGGASSSCAAASGSCLSCGFAMVDEPFDPAPPDGTPLMAPRARNGLATPDPTPDFRPPRLIG